MGKKANTQQMLMAAIAQMQAQIAKMQEPSSNPAQQYLTNEALAGAEYFKKGDYSQKPKGMFFDYQMPAEQNEQYKKFANVSQGGTFALGDSGGQTGAQGIQTKYLSDKFARDASQNYQNNVKDAAQNVRGGLGAAAGAQKDNNSAVMSALQGLTGILGSMPKQTPWWQQVLKGAIGGASAFGV